MMKKLSLVLLLCFAQTGFAHCCFNGFYAKGGLGATQPLFDINQNFMFNLGSIIDFSFPMDRDFSVTAFSGMIGGGYSFQADSIWVLSGEFVAEFTNAENSFESIMTIPDEDITISSQITTTLRNNFALLFKPGVIIQGKTQFYALLGPRWGNFESSVETDVNYEDLSTGSSTVNNSEYVLGFTVGLGVERLIADGFSVSLEYSYTTYGSIPSASTTFDTTTIGIVTPVASNDVDIQASANTLMADVSYRF